VLSERNITDNRRKENMAEKITLGQAQTLMNMVKQFMQEVIEPLDVELTATATLVMALKQTHPDLSPEIDSGLASLLKQPALLGIMHQKYHASLELSARQFLERIQETADIDESFEAFLRDWKPGLVN
jgi:hypothetical protein